MFPIRLASLAFFMIAVTLFAAVPVSAEPDNDGADQGEENIIMQDADENYDESLTEEEAAALMADTQAPINEATPGEEKPENNNDEIEETIPGDVTAGNDQESAITAAEPQSPAVPADEEAKEKADTTDESPAPGKNENKRWWGRPY